MNSWVLWIMVLLWHLSIYPCLGVDSANPCSPSPGSAPSQDVAVGGRPAAFPNGPGLFNLVLFGTRVPMIDRAEYSQVLQVIIWESEGHGARAQFGFTREAEEGGELRV